MFTESQREQRIIAELEQLSLEFRELSKELTSSNINFSSTEYLNSTKRYSFLSKVIDFYEQCKVLHKNIIELDDLLLQSTNEQEFLILLKEEKIKLKNKYNCILREIETLLYPATASEAISNIIMEIRAGTGGNEACLFVGDLYRMYCKFIEKQNWKMKLLNFSINEYNAFKEIIYTVSGYQAHTLLQFETGVHRVQRIPLTESNDRIHTSTVTISVLLEHEDNIDITFNSNELKIDTYRSQGAGGQHVNTTDSAVRITHIPTGVVVQCQSEKSQHKNKENAMRILKVKLKNKILKEKKEELSKQRKQQIGNAERSEKIRTYNFPQNRLTDHRINYSFHNKLIWILDGNLVEVIDCLKHNL